MIELGERVPPDSTLNLEDDVRTCKKCGGDVGNSVLSCPLCGASLSLDAFLSVAVMKFLGIVCGGVGIALLVYADHMGAANPYVLWLCSGVLLVVGFFMFFRKWQERGGS